MTRSAGRPWPRGSGRRVGLLTNGYFIARSTRGHIGAGTTETALKWCVWQCRNEKRQEELLAVIAAQRARMLGLAR
jgi:hypothetical protein